MQNEDEPGNRFKKGKNPAALARPFPVGNSHYYTNSTLPCSLKSPGGTVHTSVFMCVCSGYVNRRVLVLVHVSLLEMA